VIEQALAHHEGGPKADAWVFDRGDGWPPSVTQLHGWFGKFRARHKLAPHLRIHDFRGAVVTALADAGATISTAQQALGHSNVITTLTYYSLSREGSVQKGMDKVFEALATASEDGEEGSEGGGEGGSHQKSHQIGEAQPVWQVEKTGQNDLFRTRDGGGERGIRTLDGVAPKPHFQCGAIDH